MDRDQYIRAELTELLDGRQAHVTFREAVKGLPWEMLGHVVGEFENTIWQIVEHMRIAQWDILEFSRDAEHVSPRFPEGYWPRTKAPASQGEWGHSLERFKQDLQEIKSLVLDSEENLWEPFPHGQGQTLFREVLVLADHNAYHIGQIVCLRKQLGIWGGSGSSHP